MSFSVKDIYFFDVETLRSTLYLCFVSQLILIASLLKLTDGRSDFLSRSQLVLMQCHFSMSISFAVPFFFCFVSVFMLILLASGGISIILGLCRSDSVWSKGGKSSK